MTVDIKNYIYHHRKTDNYGMDRIARYRINAFENKDIKSSYALLSEEELGASIAPDYFEFPILFI